MEEEVQVPVRTIRMAESWHVTEKLGEGSIGVVHGVIHSETGELAAIKEVIATPAAERELLALRFAPTVRNVIRIVEHAEVNGSLFMRMPRAEKSLRQHLKASGGKLPEDEAVVVLADLATALKDVGRVFHRDIKPENVLFYDGHWCLSDFGIARAADAQTATHTWKGAALNAYAAPERWNDDAFSEAGDIYSVGVLVYEALTGRRPFPGPYVEDFKSQHTLSPVPPLTAVDHRLAGLIEQMLEKVPGRRPGAESILDRVGRIGAAEPSGGRQRVLQVILDRQRVQREAIAEVAAQQAADRRRSDLHTGATDLFHGISETLAGVLASLNDEAGAEVGDNIALDGDPSSWQAVLEHSVLSVRLHDTEEPARRAYALPFDVVAAGDISIHSRDRSWGRSHSLWYCDPKKEGEFGWYEVAFAHPGGEGPFAAMPSDEQAGVALSESGDESTICVWPFTSVIVHDLDEFVDRWLDWFAASAEGQLQQPTAIPERDVTGSWRSTVSSQSLELHP